MQSEKQEQLIQELLQFGFDMKYINAVLPLTDNSQKAVELIIQMQEDENKQQQNLPFNIDFSQLQVPDFNIPLRKSKMVFMVRMDLKMGIGKIAAQTGHAAMWAYDKIKEKSKHDKDAKQNLDDWLRCGTAKIVLKVESKEEFIELEKRARENGINTYIVQDAGRTQVEPGSITVAAIGPADSDKIDSITGNLKLL